MEGQTSEQIKQQIEALSSASEQQPVAQPEPQPQQVVQSAPEVKVEVTGDKQESQVKPSADVAQAAQVEQKTEEVKALDALMKEKGITDPNTIAKMYKDLQSEFTRKSQELSRLKNQEVQSQQQSLPVNNNMDAANQAFVNDFVANPLLAIAKLTEAISVERIKTEINPLREAHKTAILNDKIIQLSTSPETATTFNLKPVQDEIRKVIEEDPTMLDNLPNKLSIAHDIALGRLARKGFTVNANTQTAISGQVPTPEASRGRSVEIGTVDTSKMTSKQLEEYIRTITG